jgi:hypothetical protein
MLATTNYSETARSLVSACLKAAGRRADARRLRAHAAVAPLLAGRATWQPRPALRCAMPAGAAPPSPASLRDVETWSLSELFYFWQLAGGRVKVRSLAMVVLCLTSRRVRRRWRPKYAPDRPYSDCRWSFGLTTMARRRMARRRRRPTSGSMPSISPMTNQRPPSTTTMTTMTMVLTLLLLAHFVFAATSTMMCDCCLPLCVFLFDRSLFC